MHLLQIAGPIPGATRAAHLGNIRDLTSKPTLNNLKNIKYYNTLIAPR